MRHFEARIEIFVDDETIEMNREEGDEDLEDELIVEDMLRSGAEVLIFGEIEVVDVEDVEDVE